ncbi:MAG: hypothetical protein ACXWLR_03160 [Myxococcales bacterium]
MKAELARFTERAWHPHPIGECVEDVIIDLFTRLVPAGLAFVLAFHLAIHASRSLAKPSDLIDSGQRPPLMQYVEGAATTLLLILRRLGRFRAFRAESGGQQVHEQLGRS